MIKTIRLQYDIELSPDDLRALARAAGIMEEITSSAVGFEVKSIPSALNCTRYSIKEFCHCMQMLEDLCLIGKLEGYFDKDSK